MTPPEAVSPSSSVAPARAPSRVARAWRTAEDAVLSLAILAMALLPVIDFVGRTVFQRGLIEGSSDYLQHLTLWLAFLGAMAAARDDRHLKIAAAAEWLPPRGRAVAHGLGAFAATAVCLALAGASLELVVSEAPPLPEAWRAILPGLLTRWLEPFGLFYPGNMKQVAGWLPVWAAEALMPLGFLVMAVRFALRGGSRWWWRAGAALALPMVIGLALLPGDPPGGLVVAGIVGLVIAAFLGAPIFVMLGGAAVLLFRGEGVTIAAIPTETYRMVIQPVLPTIPIFTLAGFMLSEGRASDRLVRVFRAWFGWMPGGAAVAATLLCAFFTTFTGASGVTILALGGLLLPVLIGSGFTERFSIGLLTSTGSIGLLLPPSLVVILYGVIAHVSILEMFKASLLPGLLLILPVCLLCGWQGYRSGAPRQPFRLREALAALWMAKWEVAIPVLILVLLFGGFCTLVEAAAITVVYAILAEAIIHRDVKPRAFFAMLVRCATLVGGVLIILGVAMGLTNYLVDAQVPMHATDWARAHVHSRWVFLLGLNGALLIVGCLMDIFSALVVVVPLILPMSAFFGVNPAHLGVIFLANLQLGYLTPPVGMNLFLASFRFERPLTAVSRYALPFLLIMAVVVLLVTYIPALSIGVASLLR